MLDRSRSSRRTPRWLVGAALATCLVAGAVAAPASAAPDQHRGHGSGKGASGHGSGKGGHHQKPKASSFVEDFAEADADHGAMVRWWWPSAVDADVAVEQLREVADAGYKGVEIAFVMDGTDYAVDPDEHEYGDPSWQAAVKAVLDEADDLGVQVDLTLGGRWPAAVPGLDVDGDAASQELVAGSTVVAAGDTYGGAVPQPTPRTYEDRTSDDGVITSTTKTATPHYVTATAARCVTDCSEDRPRIDLESVTDISDAVDGDTIDWTAPGDGTWLVTGYWRRGTAQRNDAPFGSTVSLLSDPESRVVDHFGREGTDAFLAFFDTLLDRETRKLLRRAGGSIFEDSLELKHAQPWTPSFIAAFEDTNGYSVLPYLPALAHVAPASPFAPASPMYTFGDGQDETAQRVLHDVDETLNDLWTDNHVRPIKRWAHRLGLTFRAQAYGEPLDLGSAANALDISECETLGCSEDQFRTVATSVALASKDLVSSEMLPGGFGNLYGLTQAQITAGVNREYALGGNQMVFHGLPYPTVPPSADGTITDDASFWPGFHAFSSNIGEAFGPRQPSWGMQSDVADYYARTQQTLQTGNARYDVAVLNAVLGAEESATDGAFLDEAGYTFGYVTPGSLAGQKVKRGVLAPNGPGFQALVIGSEPITLATAEQILTAVRRGLPLVVIGDGPEHAAGYAADSDAAAALDLKLERTFDRIVDAPSTQVVADESAALDALAATGVAAEAQASDTGVKVVHREDDDRDLYVLVNRTDDAQTVDVTLSGSRRAVPYALDPWTGDVSPVGVYTTDRDQITITGVEIPAGSTALYAMASTRFAGEKVGSEHVTATTAADATWTAGVGRGKRSAGTLTVRASENGTATSQLSNGTTVRTQVRGVADEQQLGDWDLVLDEWLPGDADDASDVTRHVEHTIDGVALTSWTEIDGIEDAVGIGTYTTEVQADRDLARSGAVLDLGAVSGSYRVRVNGKAVAVADQLGTEVDLGDALRPGRNVIEVEVASTMLNRLRITRPAEFGGRTPTTNGLLGPIALQPYVEVSQQVR